jgi:hypothetical protein
LHYRRSHNQGLIPLPSRTSFDPWLGRPALGSDKKTRTRAKNSRTLPDFSCAAVRTILAAES